VISVSREATETAPHILALREDHRTMVTAQLGRVAANAHRVLEHLYQRPILGVADVRQLTGTTYTAANNLVSRLSDLGIIQETTSNRRNRLFRYKPYIRIFHESPPEGDDNNDRARETAL
jgi:cell filamentation protein, protein adenylyltransferase